MENKRVTKDYNTQLTLSPSRRSVRSITNTQTNCHSVTKNHRPPQNVTYGELQIILQNVQIIKGKASQQIKGLQDKNEKLERQVLELKGIIENSRKEKQEKIEGKIKEQKYMKQRLVQLQRETEERAERIRELEKREKKYEEEIERKEGEIREKEKAYFEERQKREDYENKYEQMVQKLGVGCGQQVNRVQRQFNGLGQLLSRYSETKLQKEYRERQLEKEVQNNKYNRERISEYNRVVERVTQQNTTLVDKVDSLHLNIKELEIEIVKNSKQHQQQCSRLQSIMSEQQIQHDEELAQKEKIVREKEGTISRLNNQLLVSKQQVENRQIQEDSLNEEIVFKKIVDEVCNEQQDYQNIINRVQYLQKYRNQYYYNIEKIQFMCKILDQ